MNNKIATYIEILTKLSDLEFQRDVWVRQKYWDRILNLGEAINTLEDYNFFENVKRREFDFGDSEYSDIDEFVVQLLDYDEPINNIGDMLNDPKWEKITRNAHKMANCFLD